MKDKNLNILKFPKREDEGPIDQRIQNVSEDLHTLEVIRKEICKKQKELFVMLHKLRILDSGEGSWVKAFKIAWLEIKEQLFKDVESALWFTSGLMLASLWVVFLFFKLKQ